MADNVTVDNNALTDYTVASDDDGTAQHQYVKLEWGPDNTQTKVNTGSGSLPVQGAAASGAATAGNPVLGGGVNRTTLPTLTDGQAGEFQLDTRGKLKVCLTAQDGTNAASIASSVGSTDSLGTSQNGFTNYAFVMGYNGSTWDRVRGDTTNGLTVNLGANNDVQGAAASGAAASGNPVQIGGVQRTTQPTLTDGQVGELQADTRGNLQVSIMANDGTTGAFVSAPTDGTERNGLAVNSQNLVYNGSTWDRVRGDTTNGLDVDVTRVSGTVTTTIVPATSGGLSIFRSLDLDETEEDVKTSAGQMYGYYIWNGAASTRFVKLYNATAANVTVGSTTPVITIPVPAGAAANASFEQGIAFGTAICAAATTGVADADTGAPSANDVVVNIYYK